MTDEFLTKGLENDRYLKALRLINQFEDEVEAALHEFNQRMVDEHPDLFESRTDTSTKSNRSSSSGIATHRINHLMKGPRAPEQDKTQRLNVHLYWMPPTEYGRRDVDGALRTVGYKVKYADPAIDEEVAEQTRNRDWDIETSKNPYDSNTVFYRHVSSAGDFKGTMDTLVKHFSEFGDAYAID
ncbi:hypothetical protein [Halorussus halophilus]|uniref:hypothetical protein n=1 Tax=Halorussus halophilus TaxID=2650975 RepID=UPI001300E52A|nr:hypothetical protein [Halorussus halophilus]